MADILNGLSDEEAVDRLARKYARYTKGEFSSDILRQIVRDCMLSERKRCAQIAVTAFGKASAGQAFGVRIADLIRDGA